MAPTIQCIGNFLVGRSLNLYTGDYPTHLAITFFADQASCRSSASVARTIASTSRRGGRESPARPTARTRASRTCQRGWVVSASLTTGRCTAVDFGACANISAVANANSRECGTNRASTSCVDNSPATSGSRLLQTCNMAYLAWIVTARTYDALQHIGWHGPINRMRMTCKNVGRAATAGARLRVRWSSRARRWAEFAAFANPVSRAL